MKNKRKKDYRLNLRIPRDLEAFIKAYADRNNTTVSQIVTKHFTEIKKREEGDGVQQF